MQRLGEDDQYLDNEQTPQRISRTRAFFRTLFFGDTVPGTLQGRRTAFKRGILLAFGVGALICIPVAAVLLVKGATLTSLILPLALVMLACVVTAMVSMLIYSCVKRCQGSYQRNTQLTEREVVYRPTPGHDFSSNNTFDPDQDFSNPPPLNFDSGKSDIYLREYTPTQGSSTQTPHSGAQPFGTVNSDTTPKSEYDFN